ncbi:unnamed protein product [Rhizophagus irregularis]|nr:unnamed protein product [Rhizophagus irregularis]CAB5187762.1 unnamed protein product [Rhizophagus irregularis]CAB5187764.1 unnamed protein product [Rhizophagus irregularis]
MATSDEHRWRYDIIDCKNDEKTYQILLILNTCLNCIFILISASLICWKLKLRLNVKFWSKEAWLPMNLFFLWFILYYLLRSFASLVVLLGLFTDKIFIVIMIYDLSWSPGIIAILLYIKGMFHLMPRLTFDQFTNNCSHNKKPTKKIWIPEDQSVNLTFWSVSVFTVFIMLIFSLLKSYFYNQEKKSYPILEVPLLVSSLFISFLFLYYGVILITLTKNSFILSEEDNFENDRNHLSFVFQQNKLKLKKYLRKMMLFNFFCGINFLLIAISIVFFFFPDKTRTMFTLNLILCILTYVIFPTFTIVLHIVMILLEITKRHSNNSTVTVHVETTQLYSVQSKPILTNDQYNNCKPSI